MGGEPLLLARGVEKVYRSGTLEVAALRHLELTVQPGELVGVMGPSGSGKTTLLNCLSGLDDIDGGTVQIDGRDLFAMSDRERTDHRARHMGFVFQAFNLIPVFSAVARSGRCAARSARSTACGRPSPTWRVPVATARRPDLDTPSRSLR